MKLGNVFLIFLILVIVMLTGTASAAITQTGNLITIDSSTSATLTDINTAISNSSALQDLGSGEWLLSANILVDTGATLTLNDSDCTWLKMNGTDGNDPYIQTWGTLDIDDTKITSWNTSSSSVVYATSSTSRPYIIYGDSGGAKDSYGHIINSNVSYLGYSGTGTDGLYFYGWYNSGGDALLTNNTFINLYSINFRRYFGDIVINECFINDSISTAINTWAYGSWDSFLINNSVIDTSNPSSAYTGGLYLGPVALVKNTEFTVRQGTAIHQEIGGSTFDNVTIYEGAYAGFEIRQDTTITNSTVYETSAKGGLYLVYEDSIPGSWNLTLASADGSGVRIYKITESSTVDLSNVYIYDRTGTDASAISVQDNGDYTVYNAHIMETQSVADIYMVGTAPHNITFKDINDVDDSLHIKFDSGGDTDYNGYIARSDNIYLENEDSTHYSTYFYPDRSSIYFTKDADTALNQHVVYDSSLILTPSGDNVTANYTKNSSLSVDYLFNEVDYVNFTLSGTTGTSLSINNTNASKTYGLYDSGDTLIESIGPGETDFTTALNDGDYYLFGYWTVTEETFASAKSNMQYDTENAISLAVILPTIIIAFVIIVILYGMSTGTLEFDIAMPALLVMFTLWIILMVSVRIFNGLYS